MFFQREELVFFCRYQVRQRHSGLLIGTAILPDRIETGGGRLDQGECVITGFQKTPGRIIDIAWSLGKGAGTDKDLKSARIDMCCFSQ